MNFTYYIPIYHYIIFVSSTLITIFAFIRIAYSIFNKGPIYKPWYLLLYITFSIPMYIFTFVEITQMSIYPKYVKTVRFDFSHSSFESSMVSELIGSIKKEPNATCESQVCTMNVLEFKHSPSEVLIKVSNESNGNIYCGICASPIHYDFEQNKFIADVIFK